MAHFNTVKVPLEKTEYDIVIGSGVHKAAGALWPATSPHSRGVVVTSSALISLCAPISDSLRAAGWRLDELEVPDGERSKTLTVAGELCSQLADAGHDRNSTIFAFGGGVVGDLAGFVAAIYMRGIDFVQIPTTLLAQVDASVGGKVAVDLPQGKNLVGAFHQPRVVLMDPGILQSLPDRHLRSGLAEVIKHACIADRALFGYVRDNIAAILARDTDVLQHLLADNCRIKVDVVTQDPYDKGLRSLLNLGHTVGHALEAAASDWSLHHGEAVAIGMVAEGHIAVEMGLLDERELIELDALLKDAGLPTTVSAMNLERAVTALKLDKKSHGETVTLPLMRRIGCAELHHDIDIEHVRVAMMRAIEPLD